MDRKWLYLGLAVVALLLVFAIIGAIAQLLLKVFFPLIILALVVLGIMWLFGRGPKSRTHR